MVFWKPLRHAIIDITANRGFALDTDEKTIDTSFGISWSHLWSSRIYTVASTTITDYSSDADRYDRNTQQFKFKIGYNLYRWLDLSMSISQFTGDADDVNFDFDEQALSFQLIGTL